MFIDLLSMSRFCSPPFHYRYFVPLALPAGEGEAAGEGLAAGLDFTAGVVSVGPLGEADVDGDGLAVFGEFELFAGSQPAANPIERTVRSMSAVRLMKFVFGVRINFCLVSRRLKSEVIIARSPISSNGRSHRGFVGMAQWDCTKILIRELRCMVSERRASRQEQCAVGSGQWAGSIRSVRHLVGCSRLTCPLPTAHCPLPPGHLRSSG